MRKTESSGCPPDSRISLFESLSSQIIKKREASASLFFMGVRVIMDTIYGDNLTNTSLLRNLHPKVLGCTLAQIFAPCTDKVYPKE